ncbi:hypothetical protein GM3708_1875 [Geminocystis sp. NIES-3708]|uniref:glycosyltransferase family 2 protein n=1 Tax=Geminocystis sp. NIES-3708 TaxID=1615909 RepID=UPI0005FC892F|nr:glycosyltransferase family 2 protein [Geminocystis sp. NIES-3708]BAQ61469.1 hypothetical protein GM3708_1875 [Geminocystis sp. NIES-3708]
MEKKTSAEVKFRLARAWHLKGKIEPAIKGYQETIKLQSNHLQAHFYLGKIYFQQKQLDLALQILIKAINIDSNEAEIHKCLINTLIEKDGIDSAFEFYQLQRQHSKKINLQSRDILVCVVVRNEAPRLPYFLSYYREKGIAKFLIIDNQSTDNTREYLLTQNDVYLWQSNLSFNLANFGSAWFEILLRKYGLNHWCLIVDADELFFYPNAEKITIPELCYKLDCLQKRAFTCVLLDMYSDIPIKDTLYTPGENFVEVCPYFDRQFYHDKYDLGSSYKNQTVYIGGVRQRIFGTKGDYYLSKVPLIKYTEDRVLTGGQHSTNCLKEEIANETGCLLHFKFFSSFYDYVQSEVIRKEHFGEGMQYNQYAKVINENETLNLYDSQHSVRFQNSQQLVELGIMNCDF